MMNTISILGSTGSIGRQTLDVAEQLGLQVAALTANSNVERMEAQCRKFRPRLAVMTEEAAAKELAVRLQDTSVKVLAGTDALVDAAVIPEAETVVTAVVGMVGLKATLAAIREKKRIALANKETLVCAGELVMDEADRCGAEIVRTITRSWYQSQVWMTQFVDLADEDELPEAAEALNEELLESLKAFRDRNRKK